MSICPACHEPGATLEVSIFGVRGPRVLHSTCAERLDAMGLDIRPLSRAAIDTTGDSLPPVRRTFGTTGAMDLDRGAGERHAGTGRETAGVRTGA